MTERDLNFVSDEVVTQAAVSVAMLKPGELC